MPKQAGILSLLHPWVRIVDRNVETQDNSASSLGQRLGHCSLLFTPQDGEGARAMIECNYHSVVRSQSDVEPLEVNDTINSIFELNFPIRYSGLQS